MEQDIAIGHVKTSCVGVADTNKAGPLLIWISRRFWGKATRFVFQIYDSVW